MTTDIEKFASQFGTTKRLIRGPLVLPKQTVEKMRHEVIERAQLALEVLKSCEETRSKKSMVRSVQNGISIKVGYGGTNQALMVFGKDTKGVDIVSRQFFLEDRDDAIAYLKGITSLIEQGAVDAELSVILEAKRKAAAKGAATKRKAKAERLKAKAAQKEATTVEDSNVEQMSQAA